LNDAHGIFTASRFADHFKPGTDIDAAQSL
jgi:hypothetical protein